MTENFSKLELVWRIRQGGGGKTHREYLDFVIDGKVLGDLLRPGDYIGCLGWSIQEQIVLEQLLTKRPSELGNNRYSIYVCAECGDLGCGAITVEIEKTRDAYIWKNFGFENNYDAEMRDLESYKTIGEFHFRKAEYFATLTNFPPRSLT